MKIHVGTSGFSYKEWKGSFYPQKLAAKDMLGYYSQRFATVELNNTFYRFPKEDVVANWAEQVPESFRFVLKASKVITHIRRLRDVEKETSDFVRVVQSLGHRQGPMLVQLPPNMKKEVERLAVFLQLVAGRVPVAMEFRHESWFDDEVFACLKSHQTALCVADTEAMPAKDVISTADWGYVRLRLEGYDTKELKSWIDRMKAHNWREAYVFFKHEDTGTGPELAAKFIELANG